MNDECYDDVDNDDVEDGGYDNNDDVDDGRYNDNNEDMDEAFCDDDNYDVDDEGHDNGDNGVGIEDHVYDSGNNNDKYNDSAEDEIHRVINLTGNTTSVPVIAPLQDMVESLAPI